MFWKDFLLYAPRLWTPYTSLTSEEISDFSISFNFCLSHTLRCFASWGFTSNYSSFSWFPQGMQSDNEMKMLQASGFAATGKGNPHDFTI